MFPRSFPRLKDASFKVAFEPDVHAQGAVLGRARLRVAREAFERLLSRARSSWRSPRASPCPAGEPNDCDVLRVDVSGRRDGKARRPAPR